jgi:hypothetical protein
MTEITDEMMQQVVSTARRYCLMILRAGPRRREEGVERIVQEHVRRNIALRADGVLSIVCPVGDGSDVCGIGIFNAPLAEVEKLMEADPGVQAGVFVYEVHECRSFPNDSLPA